MKSSRFRGWNLLSHRNSFRNWFRTLIISFLYLASLSLISPITWNWLWNWLVVSNPQRLHTVTWSTSAGARSLSWFAASPSRQRWLEFGCAVCYLTAFLRAVSVFVWSVQMKLWMKYCTVVKRDNAMIRFTLSYRSVESLNFKLNSNRNGHFLSLQVRWCFCCCASSYSPPFILSLYYGRIFFPSWNWTLKGNSWKLTFKRKWMDSQHAWTQTDWTQHWAVAPSCGSSWYYTKVPF